jgi:hypothetical protein
MYWQESGGDKIPHIPIVIYPYFALPQIFANTVFMHDHKIQFNTAFAANIYTGIAY